MIGRRGRLVLLGLAVSVAPCASAHAASLSQSDIKSAAREYQRAMKALDKGDRDAAITQLNKALKILPCFPEARLALGHMALQTSRYADAVAEYEKARDCYPVVGDALLDVELERYREARQEIVTLEDQLRELDNPQYKMAEGERERTRLQLEDRIRQLDLIQMPNRENAGQAPGEVHFYLGNALFRLNRVDEALIEWEACRAKDPEFAQVHNNLAVVYLQKGRIEDALASVARAEELGVKIHPGLKADIEKRRTSPRP